MKIKKIPHPKVLMVDLLGCIVHPKETIENALKKVKDKYKIDSPPGLDPFSFYDIKKVLYTPSLKANRTRAVKLFKKEFLKNLPIENEEFASTEVLKYFIDEYGITIVIYSFLPDSISNEIIDEHAIDTALDSEFKLYSPTRHKEMPPKTHIIANICDKMGVNVKDIVCLTVAPDVAEMCKLTGTTCATLYSGNHSTRMVLDAGATIAIKEMIDLPLLFETE